MIQKQVSTRNALATIAILGQAPSPELKKAGTLAELTQGFSGSIPDEQSGQTKRNPYQG